MARFPEPTPETLTPEQRRIYDEITSGPRKSVPGPLKVWLQSPALADRAQKLGQYARFDSSLPKHLSEIAILVTGKFWRAEYEWWAHRRLATEAGVDPAIIDAIRDDRMPGFSDPEQRIVYEISVALHREHRINDRLFAEGMRVLGMQRMVDLVGILGYYTLISMTINAFEVPLPAGEKAEVS